LLARRQTLVTGFVCLSLASGAALAQSPPGGWVEPAPPAPRPAGDATVTPPPEPSGNDVAPAGVASPDVVPSVTPAGAARSRAAEPLVAPRREPDATWPPRAGRPTSIASLGGAFGLVAGRFSHPNLIGEGFQGLGITVHAGLALSRTVSVGVQLDGYRSSVKYLGDGKYGYKGGDAPPRGAAGVRLTAACAECQPQPEGGVLSAGPLSVLTVGPRLQFAPDPARGPFASVNGGLTVLEGPLANRAAAAFGAHGGYRFAASEQVGVALEVGGSAHRFAESTALFGFGGLQLQLRL
jgi:hypothetical protein